MRYVSDQYKKDHSTSYSKSIRIYSDGFSFMCRGEKGTLALGDYSTKADEILDTIRKEHESNGLPIDKRDEINLIIDNRYKVLIPEEFFDERYIASIYQQVAPIQEHSVLFYNYVSALRVYVVESIDQDLLKQMKEYFTISKLRSSCSIFLDRIATEEIEMEQTIHIQVTHKYFDILILKDKEVRFFNSFEYIDSNDILFYIVSLINSLENDEIKHISWSGYIPSGIKHITNFLPPIEFCKSDELMRLCNANEEEQTYFVNQLFSHLCV